MTVPAGQKAQALAGLVAALRGLNAAATNYAAAFGAWPRLDASVSRIILTPLSALEVNQILDVAVLDTVVPGHAD